MAEFLVTNFMWLLRELLLLPERSSKKERGVREAGWRTLTIAEISLMREES